MGDTKSIIELQKDGQTFQRERARPRIVPLHPRDLREIEHGGNDGTRRPLLATDGKALGVVGARRRKVAGRTRYLAETIQPGSNRSAVASVSSKLQRPVQQLCRLHMIAPRS